MLIQCFGCLLERRLKKGLIFFLNLFCFSVSLCVCVSTVAACGVLMADAHH